MITAHHNAPATQTRSTIGRAINVIDAVARAPHSSGVSNIARETGLSKAVAHRILRELVACQFLGFDEESKLYQLGPGARSIGLAAVRELDIPAVAHRHLAYLTEVTGQTSTLSVRQGWSRVYADQVLSHHEIRMSVALGTTHPLHAGSSSKAILAAMPDSEIADYVAHHRLDSVTEATITSASALWEEIARIRELGHAASLGERQVAAASVAAAVYGVTGQVVGSVSVCGTKELVQGDERQQLGRAVIRAAADVSADLGAGSLAPDGEEEST
ncbi:IclR family transcriptional regulator [Streptomyces oceani]|uniref:IclR family transcriptional regulator n=1 Tax=Streptomyces oceani TaxID=1075402 RepID=A0A1E7JXX4_9ACTN|nr:IclR family transcriptional regulator [Streptomyces oceani]OEU96543.1 IclR family transcriptional regulator [Streptomyces oceani]